MEQTWRWWGPADPITLAEVRQTGACGVVTALHEIPAGRPWPEFIASATSPPWAQGLSYSRPL
jgi:mannonate dehydratase